MKTCPKCNNEMEEILTKAGVIIDRCRSCKGVWLDQGEINFFPDNRDMLSEYELCGLEGLEDTSFNCPNCHLQLKAGRISKLNFEIEECPGCKGMFLDDFEFKKVESSGEFNDIKTDAKVSFSNERPENKKLNPIKIPSLAFASGVTIFSLYGLIFGAVIFLIEAGYLGDSIGILCCFAVLMIQFILAPIVMDWILRFFGSLRWADVELLPPHFQKSLKKICGENKLPLPRIGIVNDGSPQAYTYGRSPWSARVVVSVGIFDVLTEDEFEAVLAHELGHIKNWDFLIMTLAQMIPIVMYTIFRVCMDLLRKADGFRKYSMVWAPAVAYAFYIIFEYFVRFISRIREYHADKFSCYATKNPNALLTALVKIGFGMATSEKASGLESDEAESEERKHKAVEAMGIMNVASSKSIGLAFQGEHADESQEIQRIKEIMRWDLWSPWASFYELSSTHPLISKRIQAIGEHALNMGQVPRVVFDLEKPESYWDDFIRDLLVMLLPVILGLAFVAGNLIYMSEGWVGVGWYNYVMPFVLGLSLGGIIRTLKAYPGGKFLTHSVSSLLRKIKISPVRSYPIKLQGRIIGRGDAGNLFSSDMVLADKTGRIFLNHEPFGLNLYFAWFSLEKFKQGDVIVEGWYRRSPFPCVEVKRISNGLDISTSYTCFYKVIGWCLLPVLVYVIGSFLANNDHSVVSSLKSFLEILVRIFG